MPGASSEAMTPTVRKIAEILANPHPTNAAPKYRYTIDNEKVAYLLKTIVEKETELQILCCVNHKGWCEHRQTDKHKVGALHELDLEGVEPEKEMSDEL